MNEKLSEILDLYKNKNLSLAEKKCLDLISKTEPNFEILNIYAVILFQLKNYDEAIIQWKKAIDLNPTYYFGYNNLGNVYVILDKLDIALQNYDKAIELNNSYFEAFYNRGNVYLRLKEFNDALKNFEKSISFKKDYIPAIKGKAIVLKKLERFTEAVKSWEEVLSLNSKDIQALFQKGDILFDLNKFDEALISYENAISIDPQKPFLFGNIVHTKTKMCLWEKLSKDISELKKKIVNKEKATSPYPALTIFDDSSLHHQASCVWAKAHEEEQILNLQDFKKQNANEKIKIGYYSADFRTHAMGHLLVRLFELHNKDDFEIHGFYFGPKIKTDDIISKRIIKCFDKFEDISLKNDQEVANLSRERGIDIAVDLMCFTGNFNRFGIFTKRCAPLQVNFLGYPGTSGSKYIDYIIADKELIPKENEKYFSENIVFMPDTYQPNEENKKISEKNFTKDQFNIPNDCFVFASFNSHQKINYEMFNIWMNILKNKEKSILWLLKDNNMSQQNLKKEALRLGVDAERLIFADHMSLEDHLNRFNFVDLFLDTFPYNAHTTCSDALRMNIPVLTKKGSSFASRVASSLLRGINLPELITINNEDYQNLALKIANETDYLQELKLKIKKNKLDSNVFKTEVFTKNLEKGFKIIHENLIQGSEKKNLDL
tara:strand:+ start:976 stop:2955 length:1980 start_codon:yes stop_codon:yes gene_type:complete